MYTLLESLERRLLPDWVWDRRPDPDHPSRRRFTGKYQAKRRIVKSLWLGAGCLMLVNPVLPFMAVVGLSTTFLAFVILDETP